MEIKVGDFVRWKGWKLEQKTILSNGITINKRMTKFTDGKSRKVLCIGFSAYPRCVSLELEGIEGGPWSYPISLLEIVEKEPQESQEPQEPQESQEPQEPKEQELPEDGQET